MRKCRRHVVGVFAVHQVHCVRLQLRVLQTRKCSAQVMWSLRTRLGVSRWERHCLTVLQLSRCFLYFHFWFGLTKVYKLYVYKTLMHAGPIVSCRGFSFTIKLIKDTFNPKNCSISTTDIKYYILSLWKIMFLCIFIGIM